MTTNERLVDGLIMAVDKLAKVEDDISLNLSARVLVLKDEILSRMKPDTEIVPGITSEPFTATPQPPPDPDDDDQRMLRITKNPFDKDDGPSG